MKFTIRLATEQDAASICYIQQITWQSTYVSSEYRVTQADLEEYTKPWTSPENITQFKKLIKQQSDWLVAEVGEKIVGHILVTYQGGSALIQMFYILPEFQRRGIGQALFDRACESIKTDVFVDVVEYNMNAIRFYEKNGFIFWHDEPNFAKPLPSGQKLNLKRYKKAR